MKTGRQCLAVILPVILCTCTYPPEHHPLLDPRGPVLTGIEVVMPAGITEGETFRAIALALLADGKKKAAEGASWESLSPDILFVDGMGFCTGLSPGRAEVRAILEGMSATADLEVKRRIDYRGILISEVFYDAAGSDTGREYIEIHNGSDYPCDLTGLAIVDGAGGSRPFAFPDGSAIGAGSHLVLAASSEGFTELFGGVPDHAGFSFALNNSGETVMLIRPGEVLDAVFIEGGTAEFPAPSEWCSTNLPGAREGNSVFRVDFNDTDSHGDWTEGAPSPGW